MTFREPVLDERGFQDLVNEARKRVAERCPEWTEHNVSDPGITLVETFAWMTEMLSYRLNRVPERLHIALLQLLDVELKPPVAAFTRLRFRLAEPAAHPIEIPARETEVTGTLGSGAVFRVRDSFTVEPLRPDVLILQRNEAPGAFVTVNAADGVVAPRGVEQPAFSTPPTPPDARTNAAGDALYLGFERPLGSLVLRIEVQAERAKGVGIKPADPPLRWEASRSAGEAEIAGGEVAGDAGWVPVELLEDTTGGFNRGEGTIELQMPPRTTATTVAGRNLHWVCCRVTETTRSGMPSPRYTQPPRIHRITAYPVGALLPAEAATSHAEEVVGESDGTPGQAFAVRHAPALTLRDGETLEVRDPDGDSWVRWELRESFDASGPSDPHFRFEPATGQIELGPAIRTPEEGWLQYGAVPPKGARLRMSRYRHGGGAQGVVPAEALTQLRNPIPGVASVTNPAPTLGGRDADTVDSARRRTSLELRTRYRAVTTEDFEYLANRSAKIARARCLEPGAPNTAIPVYVLPAVDEGRAAGALELSDLSLDDDLRDEVAADLDRRRVAGTSVHVMPVPLRGVTVVADVVIQRTADPDTSEREIRDALTRYLNPLVGGRAGDGWPFGEPLNEGDLYAVVQDVAGTLRVRSLRMYETDIRDLGRPAPQPAGARITLAPNELLCSGFHQVRARRPLYRDDG